MIGDAAVLENDFYLDEHKNGNNIRMLKLTGGAQIDNRQFEIMKIGRRNCHLYDYYIVVAKYEN